MTHTITLIPGDGIGPEVTDAVVHILEASGVAIAWETHLAGVRAFERTGKTLSADLIESIRRNKVALKGPVTTPIAEGFTSVNVGLRKLLDLYANLRPVWNLPGIDAKFQGLDLVIVRENTEDLYAGLEHEVVPGVVESLKIITEKASTRIAHFAFAHARRHGRRKVTAIHKANIMKQSDGLFLECARRVAREYADIAYDERIVDAACMQLVMKPQQFDVMLLPNLTALLLSAVLMLRHIGEGDAADRIMRALAAVLTEGTVRTRDLGGTATTTEFAEAIAERIGKRSVL